MYYFFLKKKVKRKIAFVPNNKARTRFCCRHFYIPNNSWYEFLEARAHHILLKYRSS